MYQHQLHQGHNGDLSANATTYAPDRQLFLKRGIDGREATLVLSTDVKPRLKWNAELHKRFIEAVNELGGADKATPKTIMKLMGIPGLTLYHLKSHLQKYRLGKNLQAQTNTGNTRNVAEIGCTIPREGAPEDHESSVNIVVSTNKSMQINDALKMQIEVQRQLHEQLEVQRHLQLQIEAQGKYLQSVLEKAQETLTKQSLGSGGLEADKIQLCDLFSNVSTECFSNSFPGAGENPGLRLLQLADPAHVADFSLDNCLTSCAGSRKEQEALVASMRLKSYHEDFSLCVDVCGENTRLEPTQQAWCTDLNDDKSFTTSVIRDSDMTSSLMNRRDRSMVQASDKHQREDWDKTIAPEVRKKEGNNEDKFLQQPSIIKRSALHQECRKQPHRFGLPGHKTKLELNIHQDSDDVPSCKELDLNGFSWNL